MKSFILKGDMFTAFVEGRKTVTRRLINHIGNAIHIGKLLCDWSLSEPLMQYKEYMGIPRNWQGRRLPKEGDWIWKLQVAVDDQATFPLRAPYSPGEICYVPETCYICGSDSDGAPLMEPPVIYARDGAQRGNGYPYVRTARNMAAWAARHFVRITDVRAERVQDITEEEAKKEGVDYYVYGHGFVPPSGLRMEPGYWGQGSYKAGFTVTWEILYPGSWTRNNWVWRIGMEKVTREGKAI